MKHGLREKLFETRLVSLSSVVDSQVFTHPTWPMHVGIGWLIIARLSDATVRTPSSLVDSRMCLLVTNARPVCLRLPVKTNGQKTACRTIDEDTYIATAAKGTVTPSNIRLSLDKQQTRGQLIARATDFLHQRTPRTRTSQEIEFRRLCGLSVDGRIPRLGGVSFVS